MLWMVSLSGILALLTLLMIPIVKRHLQAQDSTALTVDISTFCLLACAAIVPNLKDLLPSGKPLKITLIAICIPAFALLPIAPLIGPRIISIFLKADLRFILLCSG